MASACLNTIGLSPENLPECSHKYSPYRWISPRFSISRKMTEENVSDLPEVSVPSPEISDLKNESEIKEFDGFEFRLEDPALMLPADELFSDGKLVPLQFPVKRPEVAASTPYSRRIINVDDPYYSPRAPRCSSRWRELLGFGKLHQSNSNNVKVKPTDNKRTTSLASSHSQNGSRSIRQLLYRNPKPSNDPSINVPLLNHADNESASVSVSVSSRPSISSSSSGNDIDDLPRVSLDSDKPAKLNNMNVNPNPNHNPSSRTKTRLAKTGSQTKTHPTNNTHTTRVGRTTRRRSMEATIATNRCLSVDSPRINSSGKIVFHSLERSSSSPSSLIGGARFKHRGMERSYSGNVRITPVLNVPVCSLSKSGCVFGFQIFSSQQKQVCSSNNNGGSIRSQRFNSKSNRIKIIGVK